MGDDRLIRALPEPPIIIGHSYGGLITQLLLDRGVFAVGDVRGDNVKRVASAVGEGSIAVAFAHQVLQG